MKLRRFYPLSTWLMWVLLLPAGLVVLALAVFLLTDVGALLYDSLHLGWLLAAAPGAGLVFLYGAWRRRRAMAAFSSASLAPLLAPNVSAPRQALRAALVVLALLAIALAALGLRWGVYLEERSAFGVDVVVAVDVSRSMLARDLTPNRLERTKREIRIQLTERSAFQRANRLGLLAFAGSTSMKVPLTLDHGFFRKAVENLRIGSAPRGGTALAEAIYEAADFFAASPQEATKIILLITDGEDHEGDPIAAAQTVATEQGIKVFTIGVGDPSLTAGAEVPSGAGPNAQPLLHEGQLVFSKLNEDHLRAIADAGGHGVYALLEDLHRLVDALEGMQRHQLTTEERERHKPRYQWFAAAALFLLLLETLISERCRTHADGPLRAWTSEDNGETE